MLRNFLYLDQPTLDAFIATLEDGLRSTSQRRNVKGRSTEAGADARMLKLSHDRSMQDEASADYSDVPSARFERLLALAQQDPERAGWQEILDAEDLDGIGIGALIEVEVEIYVPDAVRILANAGDVLPLLDMINTLGPLAKMFGNEGTDLPDPQQVEAVRSFASVAKSDQVVVGEFESNDRWRVVGPLKRDHVTGEIDGIARVVGKVSRTWKEGEWKPVLALPGMSLMPREQRRRMQQTAPKAGEEANYVEGPAVMLDVLAIYR
ncbi:hypothetical protein SAMN05892883_2188 [Jatrophihabitans sp. GAS493]|uniref:DUF6414 family protein n=1 Tax=Jatrophihabitans sp. GAS493 TaxID=1907575 RepID=UPI000BBFAF62|nr:hypothetical protein [Jatrophihabitans sp. GAS493]SOD72865.1 hypothetical protein SAMN05892883_2188 [Jatrophihabitans sp. GAS493]